jgi:hypothetical protein
MFGRPPLEERIAARQRELGPLRSTGKHFDHRPAALVFTWVIGVVLVTHVAAIIIGLTM